MLAAALALAGAASFAEAKAPSQVPTVEELLGRLKAIEAEEKRRLVDAQRDPFKEAIETYRDGKTPLPEYTKLTEIINDAKNADVQAYRILAAEALILRFDKEDLKDAAVRGVRLEIANQLVDLMKAPSTDDRGLMAVEKVFYSWYRTKIVEFKFKHTDKLKDRTNACTKMKRFLKNEKD